ncbi:MAG: hypothetical protein NZ108_01205 [Bacteroidia bacterium]|nr:hypothetical protein [Bacteroidia bacterium]
MRIFRLANQKNRDAEIELSTTKITEKVIYLTATKERVITKRMVKNTINTSNVRLYQQYPDPNQLAEALIQADPEIDFEHIGRFLGQTTKVFVNQEFEIVYRIRQSEFVYDAAGNLKEERKPKYHQANIAEEDKPIRIARYFPKEKVYNKFAFLRKYQLRHVNGLTYDFLYDIAKELHDSNSLALVGSGAKGTEPIIFSNGGLPYRGFLEGRIEGDKYCLMLHITNLELKPIL